MKSLFPLTAALMVSLACALPAFADDGDGNGNGGGEKGKRRRPPSVEQIFKRFDTNEDGLLTQDEVPEKAWTRIAKADANGDDAVSKEELRKARREHRRERRGGQGGGRGGRGR